MNLWKILGVISGLSLITLIAYNREQKHEYIKHPDLRYDTDDFLTDQEPPIPPTSNRE